MRWFHLTVVGLLALITLIFVVQNLEQVTVAFLTFSIETRLAFAIALAYLLGMATGGSLWSLLRRSVAGSRRHPTSNAEQFD
jgi:lipopolysaccharide assembly protein A